jgi:hypothetical protein
MAAYRGRMKHASRVKLHQFVRRHYYVLECYAMYSAMGDSTGDAAQCQAQLSTARGLSAPLAFPSSKNRRTVCAKYECEYRMHGGTRAISREFLSAHIKAKFHEISACGKQREWKWRRQSLHTR